MGQTATEIGMGIGGVTLIGVGFATDNPALILTGVTLTAGALEQAIAPKPALGATAGGRGPRVDMQSTVPVERVIYGRQAVTGVPCFGNYTTDQIHGKPDREYTQILNLLTRGRVLDGLEGLWIKGKFVPLVPNDGRHSYWPPFGLVPPNDSKYDGFIHVHFEPGDGSSGPWTFLINRSKGQWTEQHRLTACSWAGVTYLFDSDLWAQAPPMGEEFLFQVRGFKVFDPRSGLTGWSPNAALCWRDLLIERYGPRGGLDPQLIEDAHLMAAADACDRKLTKRDGTVVSAYECHYTAGADEPLENTETAVLAAMGGTRVKVGASYLVYAAQTRQPVMDLTADDVAGAFKVQFKRPSGQYYNVSHALYLNATDGYAEAQTADLAPAAYLAEDQGQQLVHEMELRAVAATEQAQRLVKIDQQTNRRQIQIDALWKTTCLPLKPMAVVTYSDPRWAWARKWFVVGSWSYQAPGFDDKPGVQMTLVEFDNAILDWQASEEIADAGSGVQSAEPALSAIAPLLLDIPAYNITDALQHDFGFYAGYRALDSGLPSPPCRLYRADTPTSEFQPVAYLPRPAVAGSVLRPPGLGAAGLQNTNDTFDVLLDQDWPLTAASAVDLANGANFAYVGTAGVGSQGEVLQFGLAAQLGPRAWRLADLRRGLVHTEDHRQHAAGDLFVMLAPQSVARISDEASLYGVPRQYTVSYLRRLPERGSAPVTFTNAATSRLPVPPTAARLTVDTDGNLHIAWLNRVRGLYGYLDPAPLSESKLKYYMEIQVRPVFDFVRYVFPTDAECYIYTRDDQLSDFGSLQRHLEIRICGLDDGINKGPFGYFSLDVVGSMTR